MYTSALADDTSDLVEAARSGSLHALLFRDEQIARALAHIDAGRSVLITGPAGAGKTALVHGIACAMAERGYGGIRQLSTTQAMSGTKWLGEWQTKITRIARDAGEDGVALYFPDVWNLATVGKTSNDPANMLDALRPLIESDAVSIIGEATPAILRTMQRTHGFVHLFELVAVAPLEPAQVDSVLTDAAEREGFELDRASLDTLVQTTTRFLPARPQPGPALNLLRQVRDYQSQKSSVGEDQLIDSSFVEKVFCIYTGLPRFVVSRDTTVSAKAVRDWFSDRLVGQREAIEAVVETIALFKAGLHDPNRPVGTFLFVGPTGVGKTELARLVATYLFGSPHRMLRFDLSEFKDYHSFSLLLGDPEKPHQPARLLDPVRTQPFQVVLFDELEKAHSNIWDLFLQLLDEGRLTPPGGLPVDFRNTIVIATSNVGAKHSSRSVGFGSNVDNEQRAAAIMEALERQFRPEFINRFAHVVVFHPLSAQQVRTVARAELKRILAREGITGRNLVVDVDDDSIDFIVQRGFDPRYGARGLKREIQRQLVLPLAMTIMERGVEPGAILRVVVKSDRIQVRVVDTEQSRAAKRARQPIRLPEGRKLEPDELTGALQQARVDIEAIATMVDEQSLAAERARIVELRTKPEFWNHPVEASIALRDLDRITSWLDRIDRLRMRVDDIGEALGNADMRRQIKDAAHRVVQLENAIAGARRELVVMGAAGHRDALIEVKPVGAAGRRARDLLVDAYRSWAEYRRLELSWVREPTADDEPAMLALHGRCAFGYLQAEHGLHRMREEKVTSVANVRVAAWSDEDEQPGFGRHRALKTSGQYGGKIRSRLECDTGMVLQNERTLADNREWAGELAPSWAHAPPAADDVIRRYDMSPFVLRDALTGQTIGRRDVLEGRGFHRLLCQRVDAASADQ